MTPEGERQVPHWEACPYGVVSLLEMQKFYGVQLHILSNLLGQLSSAILAMKETTEKYGIKAQRVPLEDQYKKGWADSTLKPMYVIAVKTNLKSTEAYIGRILQKLGGSIYVDELPAMVEQLSERMEDDLKNELLFHVPQDRAKYYEPVELVDYVAKPIPLFGRETDDAFPSARFDISEAGKCLALDRSTACVMHLARAVEVGLRALAEDELGLPSRTDWGKHLKDIDGELTNRYKSAGARSKTEEFYAEAAAQIGHIKTAWRNPTMHVDRKYTEDEAESILGAIRSLMRHLAGQLKEKA